MTKQKNNCLPLSFEPLFFGKGKGIAEIRMFFVQKLSDINARDNEGYTMAIYATEYGDKDLVKYCNARGADFNIQTPKGWTALMIAVLDNREDIVSYLLDNVTNIDLKKRTVNDRDVFDLALNSTDKIRGMLYNFLYNSQIKGSAAKKQKDANVITK